MRLTFECVHEGESQRITDVEYVPMKESYTGDDMLGVRCPKCGHVVIVKLKEEKLNDRY
jgi:DNA-directed RNA polymerase subunit RPC12/RpoP